MTEKKHNYQKYHFLQPFFSYDVKDYYEEYRTYDFDALYYNFTTKKRIRRDNDYYMNCIPDCCLDVVFINQNDNYRMELIGSPMSHKPLIVFPDAEYFGVRLEPGMFFPFNESLKSELFNAEIFVCNLSHSLKNLMENIFATDSFDKRIEMFKDYLSRYPESSFKTNPTVQKILHIISDSNGNTDLQEIAKKVCYSERHLSRLFVNNLGFTPKMFARTTRFHYALNMLYENPNLPVSDYINNLNYSDQSHFQRECKEFTGLTPKNISEVMNKLSFN